MSNYETHADTELRLIGMSPDAEEGPQKWFYENVMELVRVFSAQGHSGFSASTALKLFSKVAAFEPIAPLTGADDEWNDLGGGWYQNKRCGHVFKRNGKAYDSQGRVFRNESGATYISKNSDVEVVFPYVPRTEYVDVREEVES